MKTMADHSNRTTEIQAFLTRLHDLLHRGQFGSVLEAIAERAGGLPGPPSLEQAVLLARLRALLGLGRFREASEMAERALAERYALRPEDRRALLELHMAAGRAAWRVGRPQRAEEHYRAAFHISRWELDDLSGMLRSRNLLGLLLLASGEIQRAAAEFREGRHQAREAGLVHEEANFTLNRSIALTKLGLIADAEQELARARTSFAEGGHTRGKLQARLVLALILRLRGDLRASEVEAIGALSQAEEHGFERERVIALEYVGDVALDRHDAQGAMERYDEALAHAERIAPEGDLVPELTRRIAEVHARIGEPNRALITCERGLRVARRINDRYEVAAAQRVLAMAYHRLGQRERAYRSASEGANLLRAIEASHELLRLLVWTGEARLVGGDSEDRRIARDLLWEARSLAMGMSLPAWVERTERALGVELRPACVPLSIASAPLEARPEGADADCFRFGIVTQDPRMVELLHVLERSASSRLPILILGEGGTGKELLARAAHAMSDRPEQPFLVGRFGALADGRLDVELFGEEPGESGAPRRPTAGLFELAARGAIFLDEVSELLTGAQAKLLRVIETGELRRVGGLSATRVDVRVIAASEKNLASLVRRGLFRDDLYYRLNGIRLEVPPLRDRVGDISLIGRHLLERACTDANKRVAFDASAWARLELHSWPGNVRELRAVIDRTVALSEDGGAVTAEGLRLERGRPAGPGSPRHGEGREAERERILRALRAHGGNQSEAARSLDGMKRTTLLYKMKKFSIRPEEYGVTPDR